VNCHTLVTRPGRQSQLETPTLRHQSSARKPKVNEMANANSATRLFRRVRARPAPSQPDFADFGTAFGLDLSMEPAGEAVADERLASVRGDGWWRRLAARRNTAR
jgi:hypothetical protein